MARPNASRVAARFIRARIDTRVRQALLDARELLSEPMQHEVDKFTHGVFPGKMQDLERHHAVLWQAFVGARHVLASVYGSTVKMYRGEPIKPPKLRRNFLSWTVSKHLAAGFAESGDDTHVVSADVVLRDIVFGMTSPSNGNYIEFLVRDRPAYHRQGELLPESGWIDLLDPEDETMAVQAVVDAGGKVLKITRAQPDDPDEPKDWTTIVVVVPGGAVIPGPFQLDGRRPWADGYRWL